MRNKSLIIPLIFITLFLTASYVVIVQATSKDDILYPVAELNNCQNEAECRMYCDNPPQRMTACWDFAKKHNLITEEEIEGAKKFTKSAVSGGTGWCKSTEECYKYCADVSNLNDCLDFVVENELIDDVSELDEARKVAIYLNNGGKMPGGCRSKDGCMTYCAQPENSAECFKFADEAGFMNEQDLAEFERFIKLLDNGETPGNCRSKEECESYCSIEANFDQCIVFAEKAGFISKDEAEIVRLTGGKGPGGCKREECRTYCENLDNFEVCLQFAEDNGLVGKVISKEEYDMAKKMMPLMKAGKMPGNCRSKEACESYCEDESHSDECINFAIEAGFISPEDAEIVRKTGGKGPGNCRSKEACESYCNDSANNDECLEFAREHGFVSDEDYEMAKKFGGFGAGGPGGCKSREECEVYCQDPANQEECISFAKKSGFVSEEDYGGYGGDQGGPGGCKSREECEAYCREHPQECGYDPSSGGIGGQIPSEYTGQIPPEDANQIPQEFQQNLPTTDESAPVTGAVIIKVEKKSYFEIFIEKVFLKR